MLWYTRSIDWYYWNVTSFFRVTLPKKCRAEEASRQIIKLACSIKVKRLHKYQLEYEKFIKGNTNFVFENTELTITSFTSSVTQRLALWTLDEESSIPGTTNLGNKISEISIWVF